MSERRWLILTEDGRHSWLGRASDPQDVEIVQVETSLRASGLAGWLAVSEGSYYSKEAMSLIQVRALAGPTQSWDDAVRHFQAARGRALES